MSVVRRSHPRVFLPRASLMVAAALLGISVSTSPQAQAANLYWDRNGSTGGTGGTGAWNTTDAFWSTTSAGTDADIRSFSLSDTAFFTGTAGTATLGESITIGGLVFSGADFTINASAPANTLTLAASSGAPSITVSLGNTATLSSILAGSSGLTKSDAGKLLLTNASNSYTGVTTVSGGILQVSSSSALGLDSSDIIVSAGNSVPSNTTLIGFVGGSLVLDASASAISSSRNLKLEGRGPVGNNGSALLTFGDVTLSGTVSSSFSSQSPATFRNTRITSVTGNLTLNGTLDVAGTAGTTFTTLGGQNQIALGSFSLTGALTGSGTLQKSGGGTLILNPSSTSGFSGRIRFSSSAAANQSSVRVSSANVFGTSNGATGSAVVDLDGGILEVRSDSSLNFAKNVYLRTSATLLVGPAIGGTGVNGTATFSSFAYEDNQTATFNSRNGYGVSFTTAPVTGTTAGDNDSTITNNMGGTLSFTGNFWSNTNDGAARTFTIGGNGNTTINGSIIASSASFDHILTKTGSGALTITGTASTLDGTVNVQGSLVITDFRSITNNTGAIILGNATTTAGNLIIGTSSAADSAGLITSKTITLNTTTASNSIYASQTGANPVTLNGAITRIAASTSGALILGGTSTVDNIISVAVPGGGTILGGVTKLGAGTWVLNAANTYLGATTIQAGNLKLRATAGASDVVGSAATNTVVFSADTVTQTAGGTLEFRGFLNTATTETLGALTPTTGMGNVSAVSNGASTTLTFTGMGTRGANTGLNFTLPSTGAINFTAAVTGNPNGIVGGFATVGGTNFVTTIGAGGAVSAPTYTAGGAQFDSTIPGTTGSATKNYFSNGSAATTGAFAANSLKLTNNGSGGAFTGTGVLTITAASATSLGGILFDNSGGVGSISGYTGITATNVTGAEVIVYTGGSTPANALTVSSPITNNTAVVTLTKNGPGLLVLEGNSTFTGNAVINEGTLRLSGSTATLGVNSTAGNITSLRQGATLDINAAGASQTIGIGALQGAGTITNSGGGASTAGTISLGRSGTTGTTIFTGILQNGTGVLNVTIDGTTARTQALLGQSTYTGVTTIATGAQVTVNTLANGGAASGIGQSTSDATNLVFNGSAPTLIFQGNNLVGSLNLGSNSATTDRLFTIAGAAAVLSSTASNSNAIVWSNTGAIAFSGAASAKTLTLTGTSTGDNILTPQITDSGTVANITSLTKTGTGIWHLRAANNTYSGPTLLSQGILGATNGQGLSSNSNLQFSGGTLYSQGTFTRDIGSGAGQMRFLAAAANTAQFSGGFVGGDSKLTVSWSGTPVWGSTSGFIDGRDGLILNGSQAQAQGASASNALSEVDIAGNFSLGSASASAKSISVTTTASSANVTVTTGDTSGLIVGQLLTGPGFAAGAYITSINSATTFTMSANTAAAQTGVSGHTVEATTLRPIRVDDNGNTGADFATISGIISAGDAVTGIRKVGTGILRLTGANTYQGVTSVHQGTLSVSSLGLSGVAGTSSVGAVTVAAFTNDNAVILGNGSTSGALLQYVGPGEVTDRKIRLNNAASGSAGVQIHADGSGPLILTNLVNDMQAGAKRLYLRGTNNEGNMITSKLSDNSGALDLVIDANATWILTGANDYTGATQVTGGALGIGHNTAVPAGSALSVSNASVFAYGNDRTLTNTLSLTSNASNGWIGDYNLTFNGTNSISGTGNANIGIGTYNSIAAGKKVTFNGMTSSATANRTWTFGGSGETVLSGAFTSSTAFGVQILIDGGFLNLGTNGAASDWNKAGTAMDLDRGTLKFSANNAIPTASATNTGLTISPELSTGDTATVDLNGTTQTINALTATTDGTVRIDNTSATAAAFRFGANDSAVSFATGSGNYAIQNTGSGKLDIVKLGSSTVSLGASVPMGNKGVIASEGGTFTIAGQVSATSGLRATGSSTLALTGTHNNANLVTSVNVSGGSTLSLLNGAGSRMNQLTSLTLGSSGGSMTTLNLNVGDESVKEDALKTDSFTLVSGGTLSLFAGNKITFNLTDSGLSGNSSYVLLDAAAVGGGLTSGPLALSDYLLGSTPGGFASISLSGSTNNQIILTTGALIVGESYWRGLVGGGTDATWNANANNWSLDKANTSVATSIPGQGTSVIFQINGSSNAAVTTTLEQNFKINSLSFEPDATSANTPSSVTINAGTVTTNRLEVAPELETQGVSIKAGGTASAVIGAPFRIGAAQTWNVDDAGSTLEFRGGLQIQGNFDVTKSGAGRVLISTTAADSSFNANRDLDITVGAGNLEMSVLGGLGTTAANNLVRLNLTGGGFYFNNATAGTVPNPITLAGGSLSAGGNGQTYSGTVAVQASTTSTINLRDLNSATLTTTARNITLSGVLSGTGAITLDSTSTGSSAGNQMSGDLVFNNASSSWTGALNILSGSAVFTNVANSGTATSYVGYDGIINFNQFGRVVYRNVNGATSERTAAVNFAANAVGEYQVDNVSSVLGANFTLTQSGVVNLNAASKARLYLADTGSNLVLSGGVTLNGAASFSVSAVSGNDADSLVTITGTGFSGTGDLAINDDAGATSWGQTNANTRLVINAASSFTGNTSLADGILVLGNKDALGTGSLTITGASTLQAGVDLSSAGSGPVPNALILASTLTVSGSNNLTFAGTTTNSAGNRTITNSLTAGTLSIGDIALSEASGTGRTLTINGAANTTVTGVISNIVGVGGSAGGLTYSGTGTLTLSGTNTYTGTTTLSGAAGRIVMQSNQALGTSAAPLSITSNATSAPVLQIQANSTAYTTAVTGTGSASIIVDALSSQDSAAYTLGNLTISNATLQVSKGNNVTGTAGNSAQLTFGTVSLATATTTFNVAANTTLTLANFIGTSVAVTKSGNGTLVMNTATTTRNTSSTVSAGTLQLGAGNAWSTGAQTMTMNGGAAVTLLLAPTNNTGTTFNGTNLVITAANTAPTIVTTRGGAAGAGIINTIGTVSVGANGTNLTVVGGGQFDTVISGAHGVTSGTAQLTTGAITLTGSSTFTITNSTSGAATLLNNGSTLTLGGANVLTLEGNGSFTQAGAISGATAGGGVVLGSGFTGVATFTGASTATGGVTIRSGTAVANVSNATTATGAFGLTNAGSNPVTLGDASANANSASLLANTFTVSNPINVVGVGAGTMTIGNNGTLPGATVSNSTAAVTAAAIFSGPITFAAASGTPVLNVTSTGTTGSTTLSGGVTGTGNLTLNANNSSGTGITLSTTSVNNVGTITNAGTGAATVTISGGIGANVTGITQASSTSAITVSTTALTVNAAGTTLGNSSSALLTVSGGITGTGNLVLDNDGTAASGITLSTTSVNNAGTITNAGSGSGTVLISAVLGANVTGVVQNSATSALSLSGANTALAYDGITNFGLNIRAGTVNALTSASALGAGRVTLGDTTVVNTNPASLLFGTNSLTFANPIVLADRSTAQGTLTIGITAATVGTILSGGVTGNNDFTVVNSTNGTTGRPSFTSLVNNSGTITLIGTNAATTAATTFTSIGSNVTGITVSSTGYTPLTVTALEVNGGGTTLTNSVSGAGTLAVLTVSGGITGAGNLILNNNNSTITNAIQLTTTAVNNSGTITNSGTGTSAVLISAVIGTNVTGVVQNSATSALTLSGANTFNGGVSVLAGSVVAGISNSTTVNGAFGPSANAVTLGGSAGSANASILANSFTVSNPINVVSGTSGNTLTIGNNGTTTAAVFSGSVTLNNNLTVTTTGTTGSTTLSGASIGGTGDLTLNAINTTAGTGITISAASINPIGSITNAGASGAGAVTISGVIGANVTGVVQDSATSSLTLGAVANLWSGGLTIRAGTVIGGANGNTFGAEGNIISLGHSSGTANASLLASSGTFTNPINVVAGSSGNTLTIGNNGTTTAAVFGGAVTLSNALSIQATGTTGSTTLSGGITGTGDLTLRANNSSGTGITLSTTSINNTGSITNAGTGAASVSISSVIGANVTGITQNSTTSALTLGGANTGFVGTTTLNAGSLTFSSGALGASGLITFTGASTLRWSGHADDLSSRLVLTSGVTGTVDTNGNNVVFANAVATTGGTAGTLRKTGAGALTLNAAAAHTGGTELNAGTLNLGTLDALGSGTFTISGTSTFDNTTGAAGTLSGNPAQAWNGDFTFTGTNDLDLGTGAVTLGAARTVTVAANTLTVGGVIGGASFGLTKSGAGTLVLGAANTYGGATAIANGTLRMAATGTLASTTAVTLANANNAATFDLNGTSQTIASLTIGGASGNTATQGVVSIGTGGTLTLGGNVTFTSTGNSTATQQINGGILDLGGATRTFTIGNSTGADNDMEIGSVIRNGAFTKAGLGKLVLSGANTFAGTVTLATGAGNLVITNSSGLGIGPKSISLVDATSVNSASIQLDGSGGNITLASDISWTTSSATGIGGIVNLAGDNTINGNFTLTSGGGSTQFTVNGGSLVLAGNLTPNTTNRFVVLNGTNGGTVSGVMQDGSPTNFLGLQKLGTGTWTITGANTYIGNTQIQAGSLRIAGADNRLLSTAAGANFSVILGTGTASAKLILGGDFAGGTGVGTQRNQTLTQNSATNVLTTSGTGATNSVVGGADGGTSAGTPANNSVLTLNIGAGFTNTYAGLIGWDGQGSVGFQNNLNLVKSGAGTLVLSGNLSNWTGTGTGGNLTADATRPELILTGGILRLDSTATVNTVIRNTGGIIDDQGFTQGANFFLITTGGLLTLNSASDTFAGAGITASSTGVVALNFNNTAVADYAGSSMYLGAVGARVFSGAALAAGSGNTYRFGGGSRWNAVGSSTVGGSGGNLRVATSNVVTGANNVIIGDNVSYNDGLGLFGSNASVEFTAAQNYTGTTTLAGGTLIVSNTNQLGSPSVVAGSIILDGGIFRYAGITTDISNRLTIDSGATIDTNTQNVTFASAFGNSDTGTSNGTTHPTTNGLGGLTKMGTGTLTLSGTSKTYAGTTTVIGGVLQLNRQTSSLASTSGLTFQGGGTFRFDNTGASATLSQTMGALTFAAGDGVILSQRSATQSTNLIFASLAARAAGATGNITLGGTSPTTAINQIKFTTAPTADRFINPGLYVSGTNFAAYDATGYVRVFNYGSDMDSTGTVTSFTTAASTSGLGASATNADTQITGAITNQGTQTISSLKIAGAFALTQTASTTLTISSGGLIKTGAAATISGGTISTAGAEFVVRVDGTDALTISSIISAAGGLTKSGTGTLTLSTATNSFGNQPITINGGTLSVDSENRFGTAGTDYSSVLLNGGNLTISGNTTVNGPFALGLGGGTITHSSSTQDNNVGVAGVNLLLPGLGARTLTLAGTDNRLKNFRFNIGDNGGPTSLAVAGSGDGNVITLSGSNTYTGTTTITRGILRLGSAGALPGGLGGITLSTANTGGGNLVFAATGTLPTNNRAVLELNATSGDFYRAVGTGFDQVSWTNHGGFSVNDGSVRTVNLGGSGAQLTWGSGGFVPTGSALQFGQSAANVGFNGTVDFKNAIALGGAVRTIDVANGGQAQDAILSGNITATAGGALTKQGLGALRLNGVNNTGAFTVNVTGGTLYFQDASAVLGASGTITVTASASSPASIGLGGSTNPLTFFGSRLASASNGAFTLDVNSSDSLDFSTGNVTNMRLAAFNPANAAVYFSGQITPNGSTYRFGGVSTHTGTAANAVTLALARPAILTGARSLDMAPGILTILHAQDYSSGTSINTSFAGGTSLVSVGSDAAFGSGTVTVGGGSTAGFGAINGDRVIPNRISSVQTTSAAFMVGADFTSDGLANNAAQGALTFTGTFDLTGRTAAAVLHSRTNHAGIFLGNITGSNSGLTLNNTTSGLYSFLSDASNGGVAKDFSGLVTLADASNLYIDGNSSLGSGTSGITLGTSTLALQPATGTVTLTGRPITVTGDDDPRFVVYAGGNLVLTTGITNAAPTAARTLNKIGAGTLTLQGSNGTWGSAASFTNTLQVLGGRVVLEATASAFTSAADRFLNDAVALPLLFGAANATLGGGGTLEMVQFAENANTLTQAFAGTLTVNQGAHTLRLTNNSATAAATLSLGATFTRASLNGGTLNFASTTAGGVNTFGSTNVGTNGIIGGWATFNGVDWATGSGTAITALNSYTTLPASGSSATVNYQLATNTTTTLTANQSINSLKLAPTGNSQVLAVGSFTLTNTSGGVIFDNTNGATTISGTGQIGANGSEVIVHTAGSGSGKLTLSAVVKGSATVLTKSGPGTLVLAGANTYTGSLFINAGTVEYSNAAASNNLGNPTAAANNIILNGGTLSYTGSTSNTLSYGITVNAQSTINVANAGGTLLFNPTSFGITGVSSSATGTSATTGVVQKTGPGTLTISGGLTNANLGVQVVAGVVNLAKTGVFLAVGESTNSSGVPYAALIVNNGTSAKITGTGTDQIGNASSVVVQGTGFLDVNGSAGTSVAETFDGLAGTGGVRNTGSSAFTLTLGANNSSGISAYTVGAAHAAMLAGDNNINVRGLNHFAGVIQDNIALTKTGSGTQILSGQNTYAGLTTISAGTLKLGADNALPNGIGKGDVLISGGGTGTAVGGAANIIAHGTLDLGGFNQTINGLNSSTGGFVTSNPTASANTTSVLTLGANDASGSFNGVIMNGYSVGANSSTNTPLAYVGTIALTKTGNGTLTLSGANTYTGATTLSAGTLRAGNNAAFGTGTLNLNAGSLTSDGVTARAFANAVSVGGNVALGATNTGALTFNGAVDLGAAARAITANSNLTFTGGVTSTDVNLTIGGAGDVTISTLGLNLGTGSLIMSGTGTLLLNVANTFVGATISTGTVRLGANGTLGSGTINVALGAILDLNGRTVGNTVVLASGATVTGGSLSAGTAPTVGTVGSVLTGTTLTKADAGRLELTGDNTYTGATSVSNGTIAVAAFGNGTDASPLGKSALDDPANLIIGGGATLEFTGATNTITARSFTITDAGTIAATGRGTLEFNESSKIKLTGDNPVLTLSSVFDPLDVIQGVNRFDSVLAPESVLIKTLIVDGTGQWVLGGAANRFRGDVRVDVNVNNGTFGFENGSLDGLFTGSDITVAAGATLAWVGTNTKDVSAYLNVPAGAAKLDLGSNVVEMASLPTMGDGASLSVTAGTLKVTAAAPTVNFTGTTGQLTVNGTVGNVGLGDGGILGGTGNVGNVTTTKGSILSPGNSPGTLNVNGDLTLAAGTIIQWQVQDALDLSGFDKIHVNKVGGLLGSLDLTDDYSVDRIKIKVISLLGADKGGNGTLTGAPDSFDNPATEGMMPRTFDFMRIAGTVDYGENSITDIFEFDLAQFQYSNAGAKDAGLWSISEWNDGTYTYLRITAVPEPSTYGFGLGALALAAAAIRRRRKLKAKPTA